MERSPWLIVTFCALALLGLAAASTISPSSSQAILPQQDLNASSTGGMAIRTLDSGTSNRPTLQSTTLPSTQYKSSDFAGFDASGLQFSLIVAVKDYGPRNFPALVQRLSLLQEQSQKAMLKPLQILLAHVGPADSIQYDILARMAQLFTDNLQYLGPRPPNASMKLSTALNNAAALAVGDVLLFSSDMLEDITIASILNLARYLRHNDVGIVGPKLVDASKGGTTVFSAGLDFILGKNPHKPSWTSWYEHILSFSHNQPLQNSPLTNKSHSRNPDQSSSGTSLTVMSDVPLLVHRYQGYLESDSRVQRMQSVYGVSKNGLMIMTSHFKELHGFDTSLEHTYLDADLSLRSRKFFGKTTLYVPQVSIYVTGDDMLHDDVLTGDYVSNEIVKGDSKRFLDSWVDPLVVDLKSHWKLANLTVVWLMDCGAGQILGFTTEAVNIVVELQKTVRMKVLNDAAACRAELSKIGFPEASIKTLDVLAHRDDRDSPSDRLVVVMHKDPRRYDSSYTYNPPDLLIGRSMFETDSIPSDWVDPIKSVDFVWVPTEFNRLSFAAGGANASSLVVVHESIDLLHFDPDSIKLAPVGVTIPPERFMDPTRFNFISVFKWEVRKDWTTLLQAFYDEFSTPDDKDNVSLYLRSNLAPDNVDELKQWTSRYLRSSGKSIDQLPKVHILDRFVHYSKLPVMYKGAQAFVTTTHGEGWGLPIMEAMSMSLPVIATNWSGITEFATSDTAYLLPYHLVSSPITGHKWAQVDAKDVRIALRQVYSDPTKAESVGKAGRKHLLSKFSSRTTSSDIIRRIQEQIPRFATLKANRQHPNLGYGRTRYSGSSSSSYTVSQATASTSYSWSSINTVEKHGLTLTKAKMTD